MTGPPRLFWGGDGRNVTDLINAKDVRSILKVSLPLVYKLAEQGRLPCVRIPCPGRGTTKPRTLVRFKKEDVFEFIERHYK
jgi:excisionase family DNA binding protein